MRYLPPLAVILILISSIAHAAETRYVSDMLYVPLRSGPGNEYRITHRGLPSGTRLELQETSGDGEFARVSTVDGETGWMRSQYLMEQPPATLRLDELQAELEDARQTNEELRQERAGLQKERDTLDSDLKQTRASLNEVSEELVQLKQVSGNAIKLDTDNRRLVEEVEMLRADMETQEAENQRLEDKLKSDAFFNGAMAVLLGVIITLVVPRLWPRRRDTGWA